MIVVRGCLLVLLLALATTTTAQVPERGFLGILGKTDATGAVIEEVLPDSPAAKAGLREGDEIVSVDGQAVKDFENLSEKMRTSKPGDKVEMQIRRDKKMSKVTVTLGKALANPEGEFPLPLFPPANPPGFRFDPEADTAQTPKMGVQLQALNDGLRQRFRTGDIQGALVADVMPNSPAAAAGLQTGDVITHVGKTATDSPAAVASAVRGKKSGEVLALSVVRDGKTIELPLTLRATPRDRTRPPRVIPPGFMPPGAEGGFSWFPPRAEERDPRIAKLEKRVEELEKKLRELTEKLQQQPHSAPQKQNPPTK